MAIGYDTISTTTSTTNTTSLSLNHTASGSNRLAVVILHIMRNATGGIAVTSATYGGNAMTERATIEFSHAGTSKTYRVSIYTYVAPPTSSTAVAFTLDQNSLASVVAVMSFTGVDQTTPYDANNTAQVTGPTNAPSVTVTTGVANAWVVGGTHMRGGDTDPFTAGTGVEEKYDLESGTDTTGDIGAAGGYRAATSTGGYALAWTASASDHGVIAAISIRPASGGTAYTQDVAGTLTSSGTVVKMTGKPVAGTLTSAGTVVKQTGKPLAGTLTSAGTVAKRASKALAGTLSSAGTVVKTAGKALGGTLTSAGDVAKRTAKTLAGELTSSGTVGAVRTILVNLAGTLTSAGTLTRQTGKAVGGSLASAGEVARSTGKALAGSLSSSGSVARSVSKSLSGALSSAGDVARQTGKGLSGTLSSAGDVSRQTRKALSGALSSSGYVARLVGKGLAGTLASGGALARQTGKALGGVLASAGAVVTEFSSGGLTAGLVELTARARSFALEARERVFNLTVRDR